MYPYQSIASSLIKRILNGTYTPDSRLPAIRILAEQEGCSPNTIQRAFQILKHKGLISVNRTTGYRVTDKPKKIEKVRTEECNKAMQVLYNTLLELGYSENEIDFFIKTKCCRT